MKQFRRIHFLLQVHLHVPYLILFTERITEDGMNLHILLMSTVSEQVTHQILCPIKVLATLNKSTCLTDLLSLSVQARYYYY